MPVSEIRQFEKHFESSSLRAKHGFLGGAARGGVGTIVAALLPG